MSEDARTAAATYFAAWKAKDYDTLGSVLTDYATFRGPLGSANNRDECLAGLKGMAELITEIHVNKVFDDGPDVVTWYDLHTAHAPPIATANWMHVEDGKIARIRVAFDPRGLLDSS
jgi:hypothetical protein